MIDNADGPLNRVQGLVYLLQCRYQVDYKTAGEKLCIESKTNLLCRQTMEEVRAELANPTGNIGLGKLISEQDSRSYMMSVLNIFDQYGQNNSNGK